MAEISQWSKTASNNVTASPDGANLGWTGSQVGPWARETMAQVAAWYQNPLFTSFLRDINPENTAKSVSVTAADTIEISNFDSNPSAHFPVGRFLQVVTTGGDIHPGFVASVPAYSEGSGTLTVVLDFITAGLDHTTDTVAETGVQFAVTSEGSGSGTYSKATEALGGQLIGPSILGGGGTTAVRDAKFPSVPAAGVVWFNTTTNTLECSMKGADDASCTVTLDETSVTTASTTGIRAEMPVTGTGVPAGATVTSVTSATTFEISAAAISTSTGTLVFGDAWATVGGEFEDGGRRLNLGGTRLYYDSANTRSVLEGGDWPSNAGTNGRIYINDTDGKLYHGLQTDAADTLNGDIDDSVTIIPVNSTAGFPPGGVVLIGSEQIQYGVIDGNNLGTASQPCVRAYSGTTAAAHTSGDSVAAQNTDLSLTPGAGNGLDADKLDGKHLNEVISVLLGSGNPTSSFFYPGAGRTATSDVFADGYLKLDNAGSPILIQWGTYTQMTSSGFSSDYASKDFPQAFSSVPFMFCPGSHQPQGLTPGTWGTLDPIILHYDDNSSASATYSNWGWYVTATTMHLFEDLGPANYDIGGWPFLAIGPA